jgi:hypothetical protein
MQADDSISRTFYDRFHKIFNNKYEPEKSQLSQIFNWLENEGKYAKSSDAIDTLDELRRDSESFFCEFKHLKRDAEEKSKKVNKTLKKRFEELRETETELEISTKGVKRKKGKESA